MREEIAAVVFVLVLIFVGIVLGGPLGCTYARETHCKAVNGSYRYRMDGTRIVCQTVTYQDAK